MRTTVPSTTSKRPKSGYIDLAGGPWKLMETVAAGAGTGGVGVVDREALLLDRVDEVDRRAHQVRAAHLVGHDIDAAERADDVAIDLPLVEVQLVPQARTTTGLYGDPQPEVVAALLSQQGADFGGRHLG